MLDIYQAQILDRSKNPRFKGTVEGATHKAEGANLSCGDEVSWQLKINDEKITTIRHYGRSCAVCTASADLLAEELENKSVEEIQQWNSERIQELLGIPLSPIRLKCALLPLETLKQKEKI
jgi:nitrogen fixation NifU-like protein